MSAENARVLLQLATKAPAAVHSNTQLCCHHRFAATRWGKLQTSSPNSLAQAMRFKHSLAASSQ